MRAMLLPHFGLRMLAVVAAILPALPALSAVKTQDVTYTIDKTPYVGFLAYDDANDAKRPGILIAPEWVGLNDYARGRAKQLAEMGYVAFVFDPYGGGKNAADVKQSAEWSGALKADRPELRKRITAALETLKKQDRVDAKKIAAIGYCFGGTTVLELARSGADVQGVVSFHGGLSTTLPAKAGEVKAKVLVCHGAVDPFVPPAEVAAFEKEMQDAKADWQLISYGNAVHSFTNPGAKGQIPGAQYDEKADKRSWEAMKSFLVEAFQVGLKAANGAARQRDLLAGRVNPQPSPFGLVSKARRIVYVCDATAVTVNEIATTKMELSRTISTLGPDHSINVLFFTDNGKYYAASKTGSLPATPQFKGEVYTFLEDVSPGRSQNPADPLPALEAAFRDKPDLVYFVCSSRSMNLKLYVRMSTALERLNAAKAVKLRTIASYHLEEALSGALMHQLAEDNDGNFRWMVEGSEP